MNAIRSVFAAFTNLAASINALAGVIDAAAGRLRQNLALEDAPSALPSQIIDGDSEPPAKGRKKAGAA